MQSNQDHKNSESPRHWFKRIKSSTAIGLVGIAIGIIGIVAAVVVSLVLQPEKPDLVYAINPIRTNVVVAGQASELEIVFNGESLGDVNVTAVQVAIWNAGGGSIWQQNVLEDVVIVTEPSVKILEASISKLSRDVTDFTLLDSPQ